MATIEQRRGWYRKYYITKKKAQQKETREYLRKYKLEMGCSKCGYRKSAAALHYHHINDDKEYRIAQMWRSFGLKRILEEISKCVCVCANCHAEIHEAERDEIGALRQEAQGIGL